LNRFEKFLHFLRVGSLKISFQSYYGHPCLCFFMRLSVCKFVYFDKTFEMLFEAWKISLGKTLNDLGKALRKKIIYDEAQITLSFLLFKRILLFFMDPWELSEKVVELGIKIKCKRYLRRLKTLAHGIGVHDFGINDWPWEIHFYFYVEYICRQVYTSLGHWSRRIKSYCSS